MIPKDKKSENNNCKETSNKEAQLYPSAINLNFLKTKLIYRKLISNASKLKSKYAPSKLILISCLLLCLCLLLFVPTSWEEMTEAVTDLTNQRCLVEFPPYSNELVRPQVPCGICKNLNAVPIIHNISKEDFNKRYAYTGVPVLIKGATSDWGALDTFRFEYFRKLYEKSEESLASVDEDCQFFRYQTEFETLSEVFNMSSDRAALKNGTKPWYIGWSNCDSSNEVGQQLRQQYSKPYFLPAHSSNMDDDWIFMGGPGFGAGMHIDAVDRPSWQAQVSGSKTWMLDPSPECWNICHRLEVTVEKGDIIVLDTNIWYHSTRVNPGNISITIGAEYD